MRTLIALCIVLGASYSHAAALGELAPPEAWIMTVEVCKGPPELGVAVRNGVVSRGILDCRWFIYGNPGTTDAKDFATEDECATYEVEEPNEGYFINGRKCHRVG